ncbi:hypothetical protein BJ742DRAFT_772325 [Cladochytrium replicatum]|nr:hypothetical protein BJ742DRAFT_772325 [Cladochytrium replicatum]
MAFHGSPFVAEIKNGRIEGKGKYTFPDGNVYVGFFKDSQFHGKGTIHFKNGGTYEADWVEGRAVQGFYTFKDGLEYEMEDWDYCTERDRRFYTERVRGFSHGAPQLTNDPAGPRKIPPNTYDTGDGYYCPDANRIYDYEGKMLREPDQDEANWIKR